MKLKTFEDFENERTDNPNWTSEVHDKYEDDIAEEDDNEYDDVMGYLIDSIMSGIEISIKDANETHPELDVISNIKAYKNDLIARIEILLEQL